MPEEIKNENNEVNTESDIQKLLAENLALTRETYKIVKKINSHIVLEQVLNIIKILVIVIPIVLGLIYLPTLLKPYLDQYKQIMDLSSGTDPLNANLNESLQQLSPELRNLIKK